MRSGYLGEGKQPAAREENVAPNLIGYPCIWGDSLERYSVAFAAAFAFEADHPDDEEVGFEFRGLQLPLGFVMTFDDASVGIVAEGAFPRLAPLV